MYEQMIRESLAAQGITANDRHVEAMMRMAHPTLDGLSMYQFAIEVAEAARLVALLPRDQAEAIAASFGL